MKTQKTKNILAAMVITLATSSAFAFGQKLPGTQQPSQPTTPTQPTQPKPPTTPTNPPSSGSFIPAWEKNDSSRKAWSNVVRNVIETKAPSLFKGSADIEQFCPMYDRLGTQDKLNFWVEFISAVALYESAWKPTSRMTETTMGIDPITKRQVASEGLLQLSYQDIQWAPYCEFDFKSDERYALNDARRTILNPEKNLNCGIQILDRQVQKKGNIALSSGVYWAVLKINGKYSKLTEIKKTTNALSFCKR